MKEEFEIVTLSSREVRVLYYNSAYFNSFKQIKYFDIDSLNAQFTLEREDGLNVKFVCIFRSDNNKEEVEKGFNSIKSKPFFYRDQIANEKYDTKNKPLNETKVRKLMKKKLVGMMKIGYGNNYNSIYRGFASLISEYINKGLSKYFDIEYEKMAIDFLRNGNDRYINMSGDYSANAIFTTKRRLLNINKRLEDKFESYKNKRIKYSMYPSNGFDKEIEENEKIVEYFNNIPFVGNDTHYNFFTKSGFKKMKRINNIDIETNSKNQYKNILNNVIKIKEKTGMSKFLFSFSVMSNRRFNVDIEKGFFEGFSKESKKELNYVLYLIEYDDKNGITIIKDTEKVKKIKNSNDEILENNLKFYGKNNMFYKYNEENIVSNIELMFVNLKDMYLRNHHSMGIKSNNIMDIKELTRLSKEWEEQRRKLEEKETKFVKEERVRKKERKTEKERELKKEEENFYKLGIR